MHLSMTFSIDVGHYAESHESLMSFSLLFYAFTHYNHYINIFDISFTFNSQSIHNHNQFDGFPPNYFEHKEIER